PKGVRRTTASIMQGQRRAPPPAGVRARPESEAGRKQLAQNSASPATPGAVTDVSGAGPNILPTGLNLTGATLADSLFLPPDSMGAVVPTQYLMAVNGRIRVFDKTTGALGTLNATTEVFFSSVRDGKFTSDPRV